MAYKTPLAGKAAGAPPLPPLRVVSYVNGQLERDHDPLGPGCETASAFLHTCGYRHVCGYGAPIDDPASGTQVTVGLHGNAHGHFCLAIDFGTAGVPPALVECNDALSLAKAVEDLGPLFKLWGIVR
jgi:hypothetical protein